MIKSRENINLKMIFKAKFSNQMITEIKTDNSQLNVFKNLFSQEELKLCVDKCRNKLIHRPPCRTGIQNRNVGFFSDESIGYKFSGQMTKSQKLPPHLKELLSKINEIFRARFNGILVNHYENGNDYISPHSDDEKCLDSEIGVVAISVGAARIFRIRDKQTRKIIKDIQMQDGDLIQMAGDFQKEFTHEIPKRARIFDERFSFTFRKHFIF